MSDQMSMSSVQTFEGYIGQRRTKAVIEVLTAAALKRGSAASHLLLCGEAGLGKTTLARLVASRMNAKLIELLGSSIQDASQLTSQLAQIEQNDVVFLDEIHGMSLACEECLYGVMQERKLTILVESDLTQLMKNLGVSSKQTRTLTIELPPFTLIGATTRPADLSRPLRSRFSQCLILEPYSIDDLQQIVLNAAQRIGFRLSKGSALSIAKRGRGTARTAISLLGWITDYCTATDSTATRQTVSQAFSLKGVDEHGLTNTDLAYLRLLVDARRPVGLASLTASLGESSQQTVVETVEAYLMREGYIRRVPKGRVAEQKAFDLISKKERMVA